MLGLTTGLPIGRWVATSHSRAEPSGLPVARIFPSGLKATESGNGLLSGTSDCDAWGLLVVVKPNAYLAIRPPSQVRQNWARSRSAGHRAKVGDPSVDGNCLNFQKFAKKPAAKSLPRLWCNVLEPRLKSTLSGSLPEVAELRRSAACSTCQPADTDRAESRSV
jgi:hypothetical protein